MGGATAVLKHANIRETEEIEMRHVFPAFLSAATICAFVAATPVVAQETVTGAPAGTAPATVEGYGSPGDVYVSAPRYGSGYAPEVPPGTPGWAAGAAPGQVAAVPSNPAWQTVPGALASEAAGAP